MIPGQVDDVVFKIGNLAANVDDAASATGKNIFRFLDGSENRPIIQQNEPQTQVESTYVYKPIPPIVKRIDKHQTGGIIKRVESGKSGIHIKPENRGKFNATKARTGKSTEELTHSKNPVTKKRAIFAQNAKK